MATSPQGESLSDSLEQPEGTNGESTDWRAKATQLQQELAKQKELHKQAVPYVEFVESLRRLPGGETIIEKVSKGEPLTAKEEKKVESEGLSVEMLEGLFDKKLSALEQKLWHTQKAEKAMERLRVKASKELPGYDEIVQNSNEEWNKRLNVVLNMIQQGALEVPDDEPDPYYWAIKETYEIVTAKNPEIGKKRRATTPEPERKAAIQRSTSKSAAAPEEEDVPEELAFARMRPKLELGKSLGSLRRTR